MTYLIQIQPRDIKPGMRLRRRIEAKGVIRTDELVCAANEHGVIVNPRGYRVPHAGAEWFAYMSNNPDLTEAIGILAKALMESAEPEEPAAPRRLTPAESIARVEELQGLGYGVAEICAEMRLAGNSLYKLLHTSKRDDLWQLIKHGRAA